MAKVEFFGGPVTHAYLMRKRTWWLQGEVEALARSLNEKVPDMTGLDKRALSHLILAMTKRLSAREGRQGE